MTQRRDRPIGARGVKKTKKGRSKPATQPPAVLAPRVRVAFEKIAEQEERDFRLHQRALVRVLRRASLDAPLLSPLEEARLERERAAKLELVLAVDALGDLDPRPRRRPEWLPADVEVKEAKSMAFGLRRQGYGADAIARLFVDKWPTAMSHETIRRTVTNWLKTNKGLRKT